MVDPIALASITSAVTLLGSEFGKASPAKLGKQPGAKSNNFWDGIPIRLEPNCPRK
jgi:hypothetical protein